MHHTLLLYTPPSPCAALPHLHHAICRRCRRLHIVLLHSRSCFSNRLLASCCCDKTSAASAVRHADIWPGLTAAGAQPPRLPTRGHHRPPETYTHVHRTNKHNNTASASAAQMLAHARAGVTRCSSSTGRRYHPDRCSHSATHPSLSLRLYFLLRPSKPAGDTGLGDWPQPSSQAPPPAVVSGERGV